METVAMSSSSGSYPPLQQGYKTQLEKQQQHNSADSSCSAMESEAAQTDLPVIDLAPLLEGGDSDKVAMCKNDIAKASAEWGFFQVLNHGISSHVLEMMMLEQRELFNKTTEEKQACMDEISGGSYRRGTPNGTSVGQLSSYEAFHIPISHLLTCETSTGYKLRSMEQYARKVADLAIKLIKVLADKLGRDSAFFDKNCNPGESFLRVNKYPSSPSAATTLGLQPHTDTNFLTVLYQDHIGGLQVLKDGKWVSVKPNPAALIVNIGDLLQAWSNDVNMSVKHKVVVTNQRVDRYSVAYFLCPMRETLIVSESTQPRIYRTFSYGEYSDQMNEDVRKFGNKVGLTRFLAS